MSIIIKDKTDKLILNKYQINTVIMPNKIIIEDFRRGSLEIWEKDEDNEINISITMIGHDGAYVFINKNQAKQIIKFLQEQINKNEPGA